MANAPEVSEVGPEVYDAGAVDVSAREQTRSPRSDPENPDVLFVLGMLALKEGRHEAAAGFIRRAVKANGGNADYHYCLGTAYRAQGRADLASDCYRNAVRLRPDYAEAYNDLGTLLSGLGDSEGAAESYRAAVRANPGFAEARYNLGVLLRAQGRLAEAESELAAALRASPGFADAAKVLGLIRARQGRHEDAAADFRQALRARPDDFETRNELGIVLAQLRRFGEAEASYREALRIRPDYPDAHNNLGNALRNQGRLDEAVGCFREALRLRPDYPEAHNNLGIALKHQGKFDEAVASYELSLRLRPDYPEAHNNLGLALMARNKAEAAAVSFRQAVRLKPDYVDAIGNLGDALCLIGRPQEGAACYRQALALRPDDPRYHKCLGNALGRSEKFAEAEACYRQALRLRPDYADALNDLGIALSRQNRFAEAEASYRQAIAVKPGFAEAYNNLGNALRNAGRFDESVGCYRKALELKPGYADAHNNLGITMAEMGRFDEAVDSYTHCLRVNPNHVDAHMNRALTWLRKGDYAQGWAEYEWRWKKRSLTNRPLIMPQWNGFPLGGRRILLLTEQGLGDTMQFVRYASLLKDLGAGEVILECPERLVQLLSRTPGIDRLVPQGQPLPDYDVYCPLLNLPGLTGTSVEAIPAGGPYIFADPGLVERWRHELSSDAGFKVGINWQGNPKYAGDRHRSIPLATYEPLARVPGVRLYSLQKNFGAEQLDAPGGRFPVTDLGRRLDEGTGPFMDTAAVLKNLDLFVTSDTSVAHLAGALGVPVWMPLSTTPDWRWMTVRQDNPWYPLMRIFRQEEHMVWGPVFERMASELRKAVAAQARTRSVSVGIAPGELIDKITILEIKAERIADPDKRRHVRVELAALVDARDRSVIDREGLAELTAALKGINETLWGVEDEIRECEAADDFGPRFVELARAVYSTNDRRAVVKRRINDLLGSEIIEEKSYAGSPSAP